MPSDSIWVPLLFSLSLITLLAGCSPDSNVGNTPTDGSVAITEPLGNATLTPELGSFGIDMSYQDAETKAGDDFFGTQMVDGWTHLSFQPLGVVMVLLQS